MKHRTAVAAVALALTLVLAVAGIAVAAQSLTTTVSREAVIFPHITKVTVTQAEKIESTISVYWRYVTTDTAVLLRSLPASRAAETTSMTLPFKPYGTVKVWSEQDGVRSPEVTVTVKAAVYGPRMPRSIRVPLRGRRTTIRATGLIKPAHPVGTAAVTVKAYKLVGATVVRGKLKGGTFAEMASYEGTITSSTPRLGTAKWAFDFSPAAADRGVWKFVAYHEDEAHARWTAKPVIVYVR